MLAMETMLVALLGLITAYAAFVATRLGFIQRLLLAMGSISLENIPDRAARRFGDETLFTTDQPLCWDVPALAVRYPNARAWSARRIQAYAGLLATLFRETLAVRRGDRVAILKTNHLDVLVLATAVVRAGGVACPINGKFAGTDVTLYLNHIGARILITDVRTLQRVLREGADLSRQRYILIADRRGRSAGLPLLPESTIVWIEDALSEVTHESAALPRAKDEPLYLVHSSGTTGFPKSVILRNGRQSHAVRGWLCYVHVSRTSDKGYFAVPTNHQAVILSFNSLLLLGGRVHWAEAYDRDGFDAEAVVRELADGEYTGFFGFPITYTQIKEVDFRRFRLDRMRVWAATADATHAVVARKCVSVGSAFGQLGIPIRGSVFLDAQGSSEVGTPSVLRYITPLTRRFDRRIGRPGSTPFGPRIRVVRPDGEVGTASDQESPPIVRSDAPAVEVGEAGRLLVKGRTVFDGYWNNHALTQASIHDGWFFTGDIVRRGRDGHLIQLDREVDVIRTRHGDVFSLPIEEKIHTHPAVFDACVYGARQADGFQLPAAAIALRKTYAATDIQLLDELNALLDREEQLSRLEIMDWQSFPIGVTGKTLKRVFRERAETLDFSEERRPAIVTAEMAVAAETLYETDAAGIAGSARTADTFGATQDIGTTETTVPADAAVAAGARSMPSVPPAPPVQP